jgi:acyl-CoA thioester hydrolase
MGQPFRHQLRVRLNECDAQGIVFNANYLLFFDVSMTEWFREAVGSYAALVDRGTDLVLAETRIVFLAPARGDDLLTVELAPTHFGTTSLGVDGRILRDGEVLAQGEMRYVAIDPATKRKMPNDILRDVLERYAA